jgi:hypothetical protein
MKFLLSLHSGPKQNIEFVSVGIGENKSISLSDFVGFNHNFSACVFYNFDPFINFFPGFGGKTENDFVPIFKIGNFGLGIPLQNVFLKEIHDEIIFTEGKTCEFLRS